MEKSKKSNFTLLRTNFVKYVTQCLSPFCAGVMYKYLKVPGMNISWIGLVVLWIYQYKTYMHYIQKDGNQIVML